MFTEKDVLRVSSGKVEIVLPRKENQNYSIGRRIATKRIYHFRDSKEAMYEQL